MNMPDRCRDGRAASALQPTVLLVDDDALVRNAIARELGRACLVHQASSCAEALELLGAGHKFAAVITDYNLGEGPTGLELLEVAQRQWPKSLRVLTSAMVSRRLLDHELTKGTVQRFVAKPWEFGAMLAAVTGQDISSRGIS
jgi:DNA-binding NtrC family response regulator